MGYLFNCCAPQAITNVLQLCIKIGREAGLSTFGAYANTFSSIPNVPVELKDYVKKYTTGKSERMNILVEEYLERVRTWINLG